MFDLKNIIDGFNVTSHIIYLYLSFHNTIFHNIIYINFCGSLILKTLILHKISFLLIWPLKVFNVILQYPLQIALSVVLLLIVSS